MTDYDKYDALIFDLDGTLVDSMPAHYQAWQQTAAEYGFEVDEAWYHTRGGSPAWLTAQSLIETFSLSVEPQVLADRKNQIFSELAEMEVVVLPAAEVAKTYAGRKPMAIGTGTLTDIADKLLKKAGLLELFDVVVGADQVDAHKPSPDTFLKCAELLSVESHQCLVFEDAPFGIQAAKAAGMDVIDVTDAKRV
ncbi:fructose-1-phosphate/6-phosphogluconate phosphatase [Veronia pacifica]|uniref:6-phosphogluconate phosphatase n=1 Tax=Veronia pacifica TaxID=1080227 RepID=A0A1C3EBA6_9GAMM|nr:fructose-1-phosphate/6-phosphogluconate phosphatase [Veronia pacifica]ODA30508.1 6-phosphogluconate phosphatase [Veronia pacifica]